MKTITGSSSAAEALGANAAEGSRGTMVAPYADDPREGSCRRPRAAASGKVIGRASTTGRKPLF